MRKKPNIVFILNDHQAFHGHEMPGRVGPKRPYFKKFAEEGVNFENAYCVSPMCGPARRSLLTGLYPHTHGQVHNENDPEYRHEVYLDKLHEAGYRNYYFGKWHAGPGCAYDHHCQGLSETSYGNPYNTEEYADYLKRYHLPKAKHKIERVFKVDDFDRQNYFPKLKEGELYECEDRWCGEHAIGITVTPKETHEAFFLANLACEKLEELAKPEGDEPFALRVDFWGPHQPFFPTQEFLDLYRPEEIEPYPTFNSRLEDKPRVMKMEASRPLGDGEYIRYPNPLPWTEWQQILIHCYAHISMLDEAGGMIVDKIRELGLDENTLIIWSTDHGDALACQGGHFDKDSHMAQEVMRIPLAMNWKGKIRPGLRDNHPVFTCDIPATIMDAAGTGFGNPIDGKSLLPLAGWLQTFYTGDYHQEYGEELLMLSKEKTEFSRLLQKLLQGETDKELYENLRSVKDGNISYKQFRAGEYVAREDTVLRQVIILFRGEFAAWKSSINGKNYLAHRLAAPQFIGIDRALNVEYVNRMDCIATRDCEVLMMSQTYFVELMQEKGELAVEVLRNILTKMSISMLKSNRESLYEASDRLLIYLYFYISGSRREQKVYRITSTKKELADSVGVSDRTLYRALKQLKEEGYLSGEEGQIVVNQEQLCKIREKALMLIA